MKLLALDGATQALSVALLDTADPGASREHFELAARAHAARLLPVARMLLADAGWRLVDVDGFAFGRGPGAFTGLRIAAGLVQGLAGGLERPVAPVSTLAAIAARCFSRATLDRAQIVTDARMGEIYTGDYARDDAGAPRALGAERVIEPRALAIADARDTLYGGNGWGVVAAARGQRVLTAVATHPHALDIARLGASMFAAGGGRPAAQALPVYVRDDVLRQARRDRRN